MKRSMILTGAAFAGLFVLATSAPAQERGAIARPDRAAAPAARLQRIVRCLSILDLSAEQKTAITGIVSAARPALEADAQALRADRTKLRSDIEAGADKCVIGQDALTAHADAAKLKTDAAAVRDQVLAQLTPDQQSRLKGCLQAPRGSM
jgi:hypothetical protein